MHVGKYMKSSLFLSFPNWIHSVLFLAVPAAEVMWPYICFTLTGPFYIIHYVQPQCPLLIQANPALSWRAALTSVSSAFQLSPGQLWLLWAQPRACRRSGWGVQSHQCPSLPGVCSSPGLEALDMLLIPLSGQAPAAQGDEVPGRAGTDSQELMCQDRQSPWSASVTSKTNPDEHVSGGVQAVVPAVSLCPCTAKSRA